MECIVEKKLEIKGIWDRVTFYVLLYTIGVLAISYGLSAITGNEGWMNDGLFLGVIGIMALLVCWTKKEIFG